jgi:hypothetical protein
VIVRGGIDLNKPRMRGLLKPSLRCPPLPTASPLPKMKVSEAK